MRDREIKLASSYDNYKLLFEVIPNNKLVLNRLISLCLKIDKTDEALELSKRLVKTADNY